MTIKIKDTSNKRFVPFNEITMDEFYPQDKLDSILMKLTSAYQEEAITSVMDDFNEYHYSRQEFADACCDTYREVLKRAGYADNRIYKGFRDYGDEIEVQSIAYEIYDELLAK